MSAVFKREFKAYFSSPVGFIFLAVFFIFFGYFFTLYYAGGSPRIQDLIMQMSLIAILVLPVITMRLFSEERRQKTDQVLLTSPVSLYSIVLGKFLAAMALYAIGFAPVIVFQIIVISYVSVNLMVSLYALIGLMLLGAAMIAIGMFISSLTESTVISAILTWVVTLFELMNSMIASAMPFKFLSDAVLKMDFISASQSFGNTIFSVKDIVYFLSIVAAFLFLSVRSLEKKRWA